ncbi:MAG: hypothetical protein NC935_07160 [Candidatus Omnitrophica bacterium]|nr:hypothetical protein [Candidatus Omnitrophota bacterium]
MVFCPKIKLKSGQTLIEVLFSVGVISVCLVGLTIATTTALRNNRLSKEYTLANKYAEEGLEIVRQQRDQALNWEQFLTINDRCDSIDALFQRCFQYQTEEFGSRRKITVIVSWQEGGRTHMVEAVTFLTKWSK